MSVCVTIVDGPVGGSSSINPAGAGAMVYFEGVVRPQEDGQSIVALDYQVYEPMAGRKMEQIARELVERHRLLLISVEHSRGQVPVGYCAFRLGVVSRHRKEALAAMDEFIDRLKQDVPIWKKPVFAADKGMNNGCPLSL